VTEVSHCGSCRAPVEWARTERGKRIPLDLRSRADGNIMLGEDGVARYVAAGTGNRVAHFATCPNAATYRKR
jgi:hypothetical protein